MKKTKNSKPAARSTPSAAAAVPLALLRGLAPAFALTCAVFISLALALTYTSLSEGVVPAFSVVTTVASALLGGMLTAHSIKQRGFFWGMLAGGLYYIIVFVLGLAAGREAVLGVKQISALVIALCSGAAGGILGVNI